MIKIERNTKETQIKLAMEYPGTERALRFPCGFLEHMLDLLAHRSGFGLTIEAMGDVKVDAHHLAEDLGIVLGQGILELARATPRIRYGWCLLPMDGSLAQIALDLSGRGGFYWNGNFPTEKCGDFDLELVPEFFRGFCREGRITLHATLLAADNSHHAAEAVFKGVGMALSQALKPATGNPSSKGVWL